jgi:hypothetical protein
LRWSESKLANGNSLVQIPKGNAELGDLKWTEEEQTTLKTLVERYTSHGDSEVCRVYRWQFT